MKIEEGASYMVLATKDGYCSGDRFIVHDMDGDKRWIEFDNGCPFWEEPEVLESLELQKIKYWG